MKQNDLIKQELNQISPTIAAIGNREVFKVPQGYFENLPEAIANSTKNTIDIESVLPFSKANNFIVPENYFENLTATITEKINTESISAEILPLSKLSSFETPHNYFNNFANTIVATIKNNDENELVINFGKTNPFNIPENYFENNVEQLLLSAKNSTKENGKIIKWFNTSTFKFSAAASVAALLIGVLFLFHQSEQPINENLTAQEIKAYLQNNSEDVDDLQLGDKKIMKPSNKPSVIVNQKKKIEQEKKELKEYIENEIDESELNDAI
ncbi:MAG: hypothetical protein RJA07_2082 [Bacteroidota bacterium]|jgi:hypothetical protein